MKNTKSKSYTLTAKDVQKLSDQAVVEAIYVNGKWVITKNKLTNKTIH